MLRTRLAVALLVVLTLATAAQAERRQLTSNVAEYTITLPVGSGPYDEIVIHRVVRETAPWQPARTRDAIFLAPGDIWDFRAAFLTGARPLPVFLAENGIDVWGIDYRWTRVPADADPALMKEWGLEQDAADLGAAMTVARFARAIGGNGFDRIFLLGWSRGGQIGYAYLNAETRFPRWLKQVKGFIPVDVYLKTDVPEFKAKACQRQQNTETAMANGTYANPVGQLVQIIGNRATLVPNEPSNIDPNLTSRQAGLLVGQATFALLGGLEPVPQYHFTGGVFDAAGKPAGLLYSLESDLFAFESAASPLQPNRELADADAATCGVTDVRFDDHLRDITVPVLYIGAAGGFGASGIYTTTLLGSKDVETLVVSKSTERLLDYGHADLFLADDAEDLVWEPLLEWLRAH